MPGSFVFCDPSGVGGSCQAVYFDQANPGNDVGTIAGLYSQILGGRPQVSPTNNICGNYSTILMGDTNHINTFAATGGIYNTIINGNFNSIGGTPVSGTVCHANNSAIFGGYQNCIDTDNLTGTSFGIIGGGLGNKLDVGADYSVIVGGFNNQILNATTQPAYSFTGGGVGNIIGASLSSITGGCENRVCAGSSFIGGGTSNIVNCLSHCSFISGGQGNNIGLGALTAAGATWSSIGGGHGNIIDDTSAATSYGVIGGGQDNCVFAGTNYASVFSGFNNRANGDNSFIGGGDSNIANTCAAIGGGQSNRATSDYAAISGGVSNSTTGVATFIGGGDSNTIIGNPNHPNCSSIVGGELNNIGLTVGATPANLYDYSFIGGGFTNNIFSGTSSILGGNTNTINALSDCSFISGGQGNNVGAAGGAGLGATFSGIGGGQNNTIDDTAYTSLFSGIFGGANHLINGNNLFVGGGDANQICSTNGIGPVQGSAIAGGSFNCVTDSGVAGVTADFSFIGGGSQNHIFSIASVISGGVQNLINPLSDCSFVSGGQRNYVGISAAIGTGLGVSYSGIGGGFQNCFDDTTAAITYSGIFGGHRNIVAGNGSFLGGGDTNKIISSMGLVNCSVIAGGWNNTITDNGVQTADMAFIGGGVEHNARGSRSIIVGGRCNIAGDLYSTVVGGSQNTANGQFSFIGNGDTNVINAAAQGSFIGSGSSHIISSKDSFIGGGTCNRIFASSDCGFISGGRNNRVGLGGPGFAGATYSGIGGGANNIINDTGAATSYGLIGGGLGNNIAAGTNYASIFGGTAHCVASSGSFIGGGNTNIINAGTGNSFIGGGNDNTISEGNNNTIAGGEFNDVFYKHNFVGGGSTNLIGATGIPTSYNVIGGGLTNRIHTNEYNFIGSGNANRIGSVGGSGARANVIGGGDTNVIDDTGTATSYGLIGGGQGNTVAAGTNHSGIFGGNGNTVSGSCSVVLGGLNNSDGGYPNTAVFGNTLVATQDPATMGPGLPSAFWVDNLVAANIPIGGAGPTAPLGPPGMLWYYPDALGNKVVYVV